MAYFPRLFQPPTASFASADAGGTLQHTYSENCFPSGFPYPYALPLPTPIRDGFVPLAGFVTPRRVPPPAFHRRNPTPSSFRPTHLCQNQMELPGGPTMSLPVSAYGDQSACESRHFSGAARNVPGFNTGPAGSPGRHQGPPDDYPLPTEPCSHASSGYQSGCGTAYFRKNSSTGSRSSLNESDTPINELSRLARFNKLAPRYELIDEKGPAHMKLFTAKVILDAPQGQEEYLGEGNSIKKAQHNAAMNALSSTKLRQGPEKSGSRVNLIESTPVSRLNHLAVKMRSWASYQDRQTPSPIYHLTGEVIWNTHVVLCNKKFFGWGMSKVSSRDMAAQKALQFFEAQKEERGKRKLDVGAKPCPALVADMEKSAISFVYEEAQKRGESVEFECEPCGESPSHVQTFVMKCIVGSLETVGRGSNKRDAKRESAQNMKAEMEKVQVAPELSEGAAVEKKRRQNVVKSAKAQPTYGKNINPVCRLYQLQQAQNLPDPLFSEAPESGGTGKGKEFAAAVSLPDGTSILGFGPSKKLAKRFAAENMLKHLGHQAIGPIPQRSVLKSVTSETELPKTSDPCEGDRKVKFDLENPASEDKQNGRIYRKRFSKFPQPAYMYPKESVQETLYEAKPKMRPGRALAPGLISLPRSRTPVAGAVPVCTISEIARELIAHKESPTAERIICDRDEPLERSGDDPLSLLEYLCQAVNMTLKHETFSRQGPHSEYSTVLTVGDPIESIGCGKGATEDVAMKDAAKNLLAVIGEQGDVKGKESGRVSRLMDGEDCGDYLNLVHLL